MEKGGKNYDQGLCVSFLISPPPPFIKKSLPPGVGGVILQNLHPWMFFTWIFFAVVWSCAVCASRVILGRHHVLGKYL